MNPRTVSTDYGSYTFMRMPNQPAIALCYGFTVDAAYRGRGLGNCLKADQMEVLAKNGVRFAICSVKANNLAQIRILTKAGWSRSSSAFMSPATECLTEVWQRHINPQE